MRIVRFAPPSGSPLGTDPHYGVLENDTTIRAIASDPLYAGIHLLENQVSLADVRLLAPVIPRSKVVCVGKNYADHAAEMGGSVPAEPIIFIKPNTSVIGPNETIQWPRMSQSVDHEVELAIIIRSEEHTSELQSH